MEEQITAPKPDVSDSAIQLQRQFSAFAVLWALASLLVLWQRREAVALNSITFATQCLIGGAAFLVLVRPAWTLPLVTLSLSHVLYGLLALPLLSSTDLILMYFGAAVCGSFLTSWVAERSYRIQGEELYPRFAPCLRLGIVVCLVAIGLARLNWTFLQLETSPVVLTMAQLRGDRMPPDWVAFLTMSMLLVIEFTLAVALLVPSLRRFAVGFGSCYFAWQAMLGIGDARSLLPVMLAGLFLFTSPALTARLAQIVQRWLPSRTVRAGGVSMVTAVVVALAAAIWFRNAGESETPVLTANLIVQWFYFALVAVWLTILQSGLIEERPRLTWVSLAPRNGVHYVLLGLLIAVAMAPYFGFGSRGRFAEASGLSTAGGSNNHLLIPQTYWVNYERDLVELIGSNDPYLRSLADQKLLMTWFEFVNYVQPRPETSVTFGRGGERFEVTRTGDITELSIKNPWVVRKLFAFQLVDEQSLSDPARQVAAQQRVN